jgi:ubiquinol-cytochrome c reductase cytochrome b subunit
MASVTTKLRRSKLAGKVEKISAKVFPDHWSFLLGEIAMYSFIVLVLSGLLLILLFDPSRELVVYEGAYAPLHGTEVSRAYASVVEMSFDVRGGLLLRQTHHWAALVFTAAIVLHASRLFFTGAFRRPRRLNWFIGITMAMLALATGFFGLALADDLISGTGARVAHSFGLSIPVIGPSLTWMVFGGDFPSPTMINNFYWLHILVFPVAIGGLLGLHLFMVFKQTHTQFPGERQRDDNVVGDAAWPVYLTKTTALFLCVVGVLVTLGGVAQINPVWQYGPYEPASVSVPAQPDWYLQWVEGALRVAPPLSITVAGFTVPTPFISGILLPLAVFALLYLWPFLEEKVTGDTERHHVLDRPRDKPVRTAIGVGGLSLLVLLTMAGSHDIQGLWLRQGVDTMTWAYRIALAVVPPAAAFVTFHVCRALRSDEIVDSTSAHS